MDNLKETFCRLRVEAERLFPLFGDEVEAVDRVSFDMWKRLDDLIVDYGVSGEVGEALECIHEQLEEVLFDVYKKILEKIFKDFNFENCSISIRDAYTEEGDFKILFKIRGKYKHLGLQEKTWNYKNMLMDFSIEDGFVLGVFYEAGWKNLCEGAFGGCVVRGCGEVQMGFGF